MFKYIFVIFAIYFHNEFYKCYPTRLRFLSRQFKLHYFRSSSLINISLLFNTSNIFVYIAIQNISLLFFNKIKISMYFHFL